MLALTVSMGCEMTAETAPAVPRRKLAPLVQPMELGRLRFLMREEPEVRTFFSLQGATMIAGGAVWRPARRRRGGQGAPRGAPAGVSHRRDAHAVRGSHMTRTSQKPGHGR